MSFSSFAFVSSFNYQYYAIGNLIQDNAEGISSIEWTVYGKISKITKTGSNITYSYDAAGNRLSKKVTGTNASETWYVRDGSGNTMAVYNIETQQVMLKEQHLYGSSRLGINNRNVNMTNVATETTITSVGNQTATLFTFVRGNKFFELTNHLGNVLVTVTDKKTAVLNTNGTAISYYTGDVVSANDYSSYGAALEGRQFNTAVQVHGFNTQRKDENIHEDHYTALFWEYDARLGRRWNTDPVTKVWISPYACMADNPAFFSDPNGDDWFKNKKGDIVWNDSRDKRLNIGGDKFKNIGNAVQIKTKNVINKPNDVPIPEFLANIGAGDKLTTILTITGNYNTDGSFKDFTYSYAKDIGATFNIDKLKGKDYPGKDNTPDGASGTWDVTQILTIKAHVTTPDIESAVFDFMGRKVEVNHDFFITLDGSNKLNISINHGTYPSVIMELSGNKDKSAITYYQYQQHSFISTHATEFWTKAAPLLVLTNPSHPLDEMFLINLRRRQNQALQLHKDLNAKYAKTNKIKIGYFND